MEGFTGKRVGSCFAITDDECKQIHAAIVRVLEKGGMRCDDPRAAELYKKVGCKVEDDGRLVKIPEAVIGAAFKTCPADFTIFGREPKHDVAIGKGEVHFATMTGRYLPRHPDGRAAQGHPPGRDRRRQDGRCARQRARSLQVRDVDLRRAQDHQLARSWSAR